MGCIGDVTKWGHDKSVTYGDLSDVSSAPFVTPDDDSNEDPAHDEWGRQT